MLTSVHLRGVAVAAPSNLAALATIGFGCSGALAADYVYTINNDIGHNGVAVLERTPDGSLREVPGSPFPTGGKGLGGGLIGQQGAIGIDGDYLLAVNPGSNTVAVMRKGDDGSLTPVAGSPFPSGGSAPVSVTIHGTLVYVANQAPLFAKPSHHPNITGFRIDNGGRLKPIANSTRMFPVGQGPAEVSFSPGGDAIVVSSGFREEETSRLHAYRIRANGTLEEAPGSPTREKGAWGDIGFSWAPAGGSIYVSNTSNSTIVTFDIDKDTGHLRQRGDPIWDQASHACWTVVTADGRTLYVVDYVSNSIGTLDIGADGKLTALRNTPRRVGRADRAGYKDGDSKDVALSGDGKFLYVLGSAMREISVFRIGADRLPVELPQGQSPVKLEAGQNFIGLAAD
jgi:DNA-binding beta-propeller fold protein YncE